MRLLELDGCDGLFTGQPFNRKDGSIQDCIHSCCLIKQLIDRNLNTMHCRNGLKPLPLSEPLETARIMKSSYDSPGKKRYVTGTSDPTGGFYPNCFTVCPLAHLLSRGKRFIVDSQKYRFTEFHTGGGTNHVYPDC